MTPIIAAWLFVASAFAAPDHQFDGTAEKPAQTVAADEVPPVKSKWAKPMPGLGLPLKTKPFSEPPAPKTVKADDEDDGGDEVTEAGFWSAFNLIEVPAYLMISQDNFFSPFGYVLFAALAPIAFVAGLIGIVIAHIAIARANGKAST